MSEQPNQPKRPWILRGQGKSFRTGLWGRWRAFGTYATEEKAKTALQKAQSVWGVRGQFYVVHKDAKGLPVRLPTDGAALNPPKVRTPK